MLVVYYPRDRQLTKKVCDPVGHKPSSRQTLIPTKRNKPKNYLLPFNTRKLVEIGVIVVIGVALLSINKNIIVVLILLFLFITIR